MFLLLFKGIPLNEIKNGASEKSIKFRAPEYIF